MRVPKEIVYFSKYLKHNYRYEDFSCSNCRINWGCPCSFDPYNIDGDCLLDK